MNNYDVVIIGAGIVGVSTALHLQEKGKSVLLLDKSEAGQETSFGNSGIIESSYVLPFSAPALSDIPSILFGKNPAARLAFPSGLKFLPWILKFYLNSSNASRLKHGLAARPLVENAVAEHRHLMRGTNAAQYLSTMGRVKIHRSRLSYLNAAFEREVAREAGIPFEELDAAAFCEREPDVQPIFYKAIDWTGSARLSNPAAVVKQYAEKFAAQGGTFMRDCVKSLERNANVWKVSTANQTYSAPDIVICAGPWAPKLLAPLGYAPPMAYKRGYHKHFVAEGKLSHNITDGDVGYVLAVMEQGIRITTGAEFAAPDAPRNDIQIEQVLPRARELFKLGVPLQEQSWLGSRPCFADSLPAIGAVRSEQGLWVNIGHGHCGLTMAPASGRLLAELLTGTPPFCNPAAYNPMRF